MVSSTFSGRVSNTKLSDSPVLPVVLRNLSIVWSVLAAAVSFFVLYQMVVVLNIATDIQVHAAVVSRIFSGTEDMQPNFIMYVLIYLFSGFSTDTNVLLYTTLVLVSLAKGGTLFVSSYLFYQMVLRFSTGTIDKKLQWLIPILMFCLLFAFSIPYHNLAKRYYLGQFPPNVWHNSTTIFLMPFALLLLWKMYQYATGQVRSVWILLLLVFLNVFIKPTFFVALAPVYVMFLLAHYYKEPRQLAVKLLPVVFGSLLLVSIFVMIYYFQVGALDDGDSSMKFGLFKAWRKALFVELYHTPLALLGSCLFPAIAMPVLFWKYSVSRKLITYAIMVFSVAFIMFISLYEDGPRFSHANFVWQVIIANYMLFLVGLAATVSWLFGTPNKLHRWGAIILLIFFLMHFVSGIGYLVKIWNSLSYF